MATIRFNSLVKGVSGSLGNAVFRQVGKRTILAGKSSSSKPQSEQQRENRMKFRAAAMYSKAMMLDPQKKAYYQQKAKKLKLPNAYTAAIADYMRKGEIKVIDHSKYNGKAGDVIHIKVYKKDFAVNKVRVCICNAAGTSIESTMAIKKSNGDFIFRAAETLTLTPDIKIKVMVEDHLWNVVERSCLVRQLPLSH
jgi:hypothetical protein